jgi:hypothetical protein
VNLTRNHVTKRHLKAALDNTQPHKSQTRLGRTHIQTHYSISFFSSDTFFSSFMFINLNIKVSPVLVWKLIFQEQLNSKTKVYIQFKLISTNPGPTMESPFYIWIFIFKFISGAVYRKHIVLVGPCLSTKGSWKRPMFRLTQAFWDACAPSTCTNASIWVG